MGCCWSSDNTDGNEGSDVTERTGLLTDPVSDGAANRLITNYTTPDVQSSQRGDEQSALNRILHETANNVIDVSALDSAAVESHEYMDRAKQYNSRLAIACTQSSWLHAKLYEDLPPGVPAPAPVLAEPPISLSDIQFVQSTAKAIESLVKEIQVKHKEDLVVPFGVP